MHLLLLLLLQLGVSEVVAQDNGPGEEEGVTAGATNTLYPNPVVIVVTAPKRPAELQDTAIAITTLSARDLAFRDIGSLGEMQYQVPNMHVGELNGVPVITVRGISFNLASGFGEPGVAVHVDNVFLPRLGMANTAGMDMQRIEVLRGPQGTLYGRNATGGSANLVSTPPSKQFEAGWTLGAGNFERRKYEGYLSGPLNDRMRGRLYVVGDDFEGYGLNEFNGHRINGNDTDGIRGALAFDLSERLSLDLNAYHRVDEGALPALRPAEGTGATSVLGVPVPDEDVGPRRSRQNIFADKDPYTQRETTLGMATLQWSFDSFDFRSVSAVVDHASYEDYDIDSTGRFILNGVRDEQVNSFSQEINLTGNRSDEKLGWLLGFSYMEDEGFSRFNAVFNVDTLLGVLETPTGTTLPIDVLLEDQDNVARAIFGEMSWQFRDHFRFLVGARYSVETKRGVQTFIANLDTSGSPSGPVVATLSPVFGQLPLAGTPLEGLQGGSPEPLLNELLGPVVAQLLRDSCQNQPVEVTFHSFDPKVELSWEPSTNALVYLQSQSGFKAGGITHASCNEFYVPEEINSTELGFKTSWLDGRLMLNGAVFAYKYKDYQIFEFDGLGAEVVNAPRASGEGAELEVRYSPFRWMSVDAALSWLDARYDEFVDGDGFENPNLFLELEQPQDLSGNPLNRAPRHTEILGLNFSMPVDILGLDRFSLRAEVYHSDTIFFTQFAPRKQTDRQEAFTTYNLYAALGSERNGFQLRGFVKNLGDEEYLAGVFPLDLLHLTLHSFAPPRTAGIELSYEWD